MQVQILLLVLWLLALALHRICDSVQAVCVAGWYLVQQRGEAARVDVEVRSSAYSAGDSSRVSEFGDGSTDMHWRHLIEHPEDWWDNRGTRHNPKAPDFKHRTTRKALWIDNV